MVRRKMGLTLLQNLYFLEKPQSHRLVSVINILFAWLLSLWWSGLHRNCRREESCPKDKAACESLDTEVLKWREKENKQAGLNSESFLSTYRWLTGLLAKPVLRTVQLLEAGQALRRCETAHADLWASTGQFLTNFMVSLTCQVKIHYLSLYLVLGFWFQQ